MTTISFGNTMDYIIPSGAGNTYMGAGGDDVYIISSAVSQPGSPIVIVDTDGNNRLQLVDGLTIASARVLADAMSITLSNNSEIQLLGAGSFSYEIGGNGILGIQGRTKGYDAFVTQNLGTSVPQGSSISEVSSDVVIQREEPGGDPGKPDPSPHGNTTLSLDVGTASLPVVIDVSDKDYVLTDDALAASFVQIQGFSNGDRIEVSHGTQGDYQFVNEENDVIITSNMNGTVNHITLVGISGPDPVQSSTDPSQLNTWLAMDNAFSFV